MKIKFLLVCLYYFFTLNVVSASGWPANEKELLKSYKPLITDPYILSIQSQLSEVHYSLPIKKNNKIRKHFISTSYFKDGKIPYLLGEERGDKQKRPLLVFVAGSFAKLFSPITKNFHKRFIRLGYRVISFENFMCDCLISRGPKFSFFDAKTQAKAYYEAIKEIHSDLFKKGKVNNDVILFGQSYGGFLGTVMYALDSEAKMPLFNKGLHVYSPPFDFIRAFERLDNLLHEAKKDETYGNLPSYALTAFQIKKIEKEAEITERLKEKSLAVFADYGFKAFLKKMLIAYDKDVKKLEIPESLLGRRKFFEDLTFDKGFSLIDLEGLKKFRLGQERMLSHWVFKAIKNGHSEIRILSSEDDVINDGIDSKLIDSPHLMALPSGGHFGYKRLLWFDRLLVQVYGKNDVTQAH
ncbi:hypothetical protein OAK75_06150 [Bacteriovoracales bacterium]|nr:hypothetical protein [Bacteriovoracales bacterium]